MRTIDAEELKRSIAVSALIEDQKTLEQIIDEQPTIEDRKTGQWKEREVLSKKVIEEWQSARCSVCGKYHTTPYMYYFDNYSFCPNCGARMER